MQNYRLTNNSMQSDHGYPSRTGCTGLRHAILHCRSRRNPRSRFSQRGVLWTQRFGPLVFVLQTLGRVEGGIGAEVRTKVLTDLQSGRYDKLISGEVTGYILEK